MTIELKHYILFFILTFFSSNSWSQSNDSLTYPKSNMEVREEISKEYAKYQIKVRGLQDSIIAFLDTLNIENLRFNELTQKDIRTYSTFLVEAQFAWTNYTKSMCRIEEYSARYGAQGGTTFYYICQTEYAKRRLKELRDLFFNLQLEFESW